jgi:hypothetical protein
MPDYEMWKWLRSADPVEDEHMCDTHAILTEMVFQEKEELAVGAKFTVTDIVDDYTVLCDWDGNLWSVVGDWQLIHRRE